jgi:hypothetical protein
MQTAQLADNLPLNNNNSLIFLSIDTAKSPLLNQEKTYLVYLHTQDTSSNGTWLKNAHKENRLHEEREREREICAKSTVLRPHLDCYIQIQAHTHQHHCEQNREWVFQ